MKVSARHSAHPRAQRRCHNTRSVACRCQGLKQHLLSFLERAAGFGGSLRQQLGIRRSESSDEKPGTAAIADLPSGSTAPTPTSTSSSPGEQSQPPAAYAAATPAVSTALPAPERSDGSSAGISTDGGGGGASEEPGSNGHGGLVTELQGKERQDRERGAGRFQIQVVDSISKVSREEWDAVATSCHGGEVNPFLLWSFLHALEESGSAAPRTGWLPQHILVRQLGVDEAAHDTDVGPAAGTAARRPVPAAGPAPGGRLVGCVPMYLKGHSYGEYVFDTAWANYAQMLGVRYYPKLQAAVPFTPVTGPRLLLAGDLAAATRAAVTRALGRQLIDMADSLGLSGVHLTFNTAQEWAVLAELGFKQRLGLQFHWENNGYGSFEDFLADLKQPKRKSIRQERKSVQRAGLTAHRLPGAALSPAHWDRFHSFYLSTVDRKWGNAYLTREFFHRLGEDMPDRILLVAAAEAAGGAPTPLSTSGAPAADSLVAAALNLVGSHALFGRNWGQADGQDYKNLHFELCYYQALEEAITRGLPRVEAGAQGEHKLQRGYLPSFTYSCHYLRDPRLGAAVDMFLKKERGQIEYTLQVMSLTASPYKRARTVDALVSKLQAYSSVSSGSSVDWDLLATSNGQGEQEGAAAERAGVYVEAD